MRLLAFILVLILGTPVWSQVPDDEIDFPTPTKKRRRLEPRNHGSGEIVKIGAPYTLRSNETARCVVVIGNDAMIEGEADEVIVISGSAHITGKVNHDVVVILGKAELGPTASVGQEVFSIGGALNAHPSAKIGRQPFELSLPGLSPHIGAFNQWFATGLLLGRPLPLVSWAWIVAGIILAFYLLVAALFPKPIAACVGSLEERPASSLLAGILGIVLFGPLCFLLVISVIGIPAIPIVLCGLVISALFGKIALLEYIGKRVTSLAGNWTPSILFSLVLGAAVLGLFYMVPIVGFLTVGFTAVFGLGAAVLALGRNFNREARPVSPVPVAVGTGLAVAPQGTVPSPVGTEVAAIPGGPQAVFMERAGFWLRFWASLLDLLLIGSLGLLIGPLIIPVLVAYHVGLWSWRGTTVGGIVLGLKIVRTDGKPIDFAVALVRSLASFFSAAVIFLGFFWAGWDREKQSWHDKIAGTVVVKVPKGISLL